jgi:ATP-dependent Clp protease ATP-binding subunit ClpC
VGKTEVARRLAEFLFDSQGALVRFDMSEYMEKHAVSKLIGSPPGYVGHEEGGQLTERIRRHPYSVVLFDEIEKAHPDVANLLLQILDDGRLTDAYGNSVDFTNTIVLMTSNIGSKLVLRGGRMGFGEVDREHSFQRIEEEILGELRRSFSPEFINRVDEVIVFNPLDSEHLRAIVDILMADVNATLAERHLEITLSDEAKEWLLEKAGIDPSTGARPLRRTIQRHVQDAVSELLINQHGENIEAIEVTVDGGELHLAVRDLECLAADR